MHRLGWPLLIAGACLAANSPAAPANLSDGPGKLWIHRTLGAAYFDAEAWQDAARELAAAAELAPKSAPDARNAGMAALLAGDLDAAAAALRKSSELDSSSAATAYASGVVSLRAGDAPGALVHFARCRELGGAGPELEFQFGVAAFRAGDVATAEREFAAVAARKPESSPKPIAAALERLGRLFSASGRTQEADVALSQSKEAAASNPTAAGEGDLARGDLLALATFPPEKDVRAAGSLPAFALAPLPTGEIRWAESADLDGDGDRDLLLGDGQTLRDLRRVDERWIDVTASRGLAGLLGVACARALDVDGDGRLDLVRAGGGGLAIHRGVEGAWDPPRLVSGESITRFVALDLDQDGDIDFAAAGARRPSLLRNRGDGSFDDVAVDAGLSSIGPTVAVIAADLDGDIDLDLVFVTRRGEVLPAANLRGDGLRVLPALASAPPGVFDVAAGDLDDDGDLDLAVAAPRGAYVLENRGAFSFEASREPALSGTVRWPAPGATSVWIADLDNDGHADLLAAAETGALFGLSVGGRMFAAASEILGPLAAAGAFPVAIAPVDADARLDLVASRGTCGLARNVGRTGAALLVRLHGTQTARDGVGAIVEVKTRSGVVRRDGNGGSVHIGTGDEEADALRVSWVNGIRQIVTEPRAESEEVDVTEKGAPADLGPLVFAGDGRRFAFAGDVLTRAALGQPAGPGSYAPPRRDEPLRIAGAQLKSDADGFLTLQLAEERREVAYIDAVRLFAVDHPESTEVEPFEATKAPALPELAVHLLDHARPPLRAVDSRGRDVADRLLLEDGLVVGDLPLARVPGTTELCTLELDFGDVPPDTKLTLHLAAYRDAISSSGLLALAQDPTRGIVLPHVEVAGPDGSWAPWPSEVGVPGASSRSMAVDVSGAFPSGRARVRVATTLRIYWDRAALQVGESAAQPTIVALAPETADLHARGRSRVVVPANAAPRTYDYDVLAADDPGWELPSGQCTRFGDVTPLLQDADDRMAILTTGDECTLRFRADGLSTPTTGMARTYFLAVEGWVKDGDPNTAHGDEVEPLPFRAMSGYPYPSSESFPDDDVHRAYRAEWNTRSAKEVTPADDGGLSSASAIRSGPSGGAGTP